MNQSEFTAITCTLLRAEEKSHIQGAVGFGFASQRLKTWREIFKRITKRGNRNRVITFHISLENFSVIDWNAIARGQVNQRHTRCFPPQGVKNALVTS